MTRLLTAVSVMVATCAVVSCSGRAPAPTKPTDPPTGRGSGSAIGPAETQTKVSEADCLVAIDHMIDLNIKERPADQQLSADQAGELRTMLRSSYLAECMAQPREVVACITAASSTAAIRACDR